MQMPVANAPAAVAVPAVSAVATAPTPSAPEDNYEMSDHADSEYVRIFSSGMGTFLLWLLIHCSFPPQ